MLKHEDCPGLAKITALRQSAEREGRRRVSILIGNGALYYPQELARGVDGAMTGFAYPEMLVEVCRLHAAGKRDAAADLFDAYLPLVPHEQQPDRPSLVSGKSASVRLDLRGRRNIKKKKL